MTILDPNQPAQAVEADAKSDTAQNDAPEAASAADRPQTTDKPQETEKQESLFADGNLHQPAEIDRVEVSVGSVVGLGTQVKSIVITPKDKLDFIESMINNTRFERQYTLFGGKIRLTVRSLTSEEVQALAAWILKQGTSEPEAQLAGRYRKYLLAAMVSKFNDVEMPPLEQPLFETLALDGKTVKKPGWLDRCAFWDEKSIGIVQALIGCLNDFDRVYSTLCSKASDENFWNPDTP